MVGATPEKANNVNATEAAEKSRQKNRNTPWRRLRRSIVRPIRNFFVGSLGAYAILLLVSTMRIHWIGNCRQAGRRIWLPLPAVFIFWHPRLFGMTGTCRIPGSRVLVSEHGDGEMIARIVKRLGYEPWRGSTTRGGSRALLRVLREPKEQFAAAITPDGPQGPKHHLHPGAIFVASRSGAPLSPMPLAYSRCIRLPTWDEFLVPLPFSRAVIILGETVPVPPKLDRKEIEFHRVHAEEVLRELTDNADRAFAALSAEGRRFRDLPKAPAAPDANRAPNTSEESTKGTT